MGGRSLKTPPQERNFHADVDDAGAYLWTYFKDLLGTWQVVSLGVSCSDTAHEMSVGRALRQGDRDV